MNRLKLLGLLALVHRIHSTIIYADSGGIQGYSEFIILEQWVLSFRQNHRLSSTLRLCEIFDQIHGTSGVRTVGIIACMLGRSRMFIDDTGNVFSQEGVQETFVEVLRIRRVWRKILGKKYREAGLEFKLIPENDDAIEWKK